jgi:hypothetical protein
VCRLKLTRSSSDIRMQPCASSHGRCTGADQQLDVHYRWYTVVQLSPAYRFSSARDVHTCPPAHGARRTGSARCVGTRRRAFRVAQCRSCRDTVLATSGGATAKLVQGQCGQLYLAQDNEQISPPRTARIMQSRLQLVTYERYCWWLYMLAGLDLFLDSSLPPQGV